MSGDRISDTTGDAGAPTETVPETVPETLQATQSGKTGRAKPNRSASRIGAVQALYQMDMAQTDLSAVIEEFVTHRFPSAEAEDSLAGGDTTFFAEILRGVVRRQRDIDPKVDQQLATGWRLERVDSILRAILRAGAFELMERPDVPARVVITEYINVAHAFFSNDEPRVVNGVMDRLARACRPAEFNRSNVPSAARTEPAATGPATPEAAVRETEAIQDANTTLKGDGLPKSVSG